LKENLSSSRRADGGFLRSASLSLNLDALLERQLQQEISVEMSEACAAETLGKRKLRDGDPRETCMRYERKRCESVQGGTALKNTGGGQKEHILGKRDTGVVGAHACT